MKLHSQIFGSGFPLVILHGLFGSSDNWQGLGKRLGQSFQVFAVDQRNHGASPHSDEFNYSAMADDLREYFSDHQISKAHVLGHSMGGKTAMQFALTFPDLVEKLVVVDIAPKTYSRSHDDIFSALTGIDPGLFTTRTAVDQALASKIPEIATRQFLLKNLASTDSGTLKWKINLSAIHRHYDEVVAPPTAKGVFTNPTLFIRGEKSNYIQPEDEMTLRSCFPNAQLSTIVSAGHWVHSDAPNEFLQRVLSFLNG